MPAMRLLLGLLLAASAAQAAADGSKRASNIIVKMASDAATIQATGFRVQSAAAADAAGDLGKPIGPYLRRLKLRPGVDREEELQRIREMEGVEWAEEDRPITADWVNVDDLEEHTTEYDGAGFGARTAAEDTARSATGQQLPPGASGDVFLKHQWGAIRVGLRNAWNIATGAKSKKDAVTVCMVDSGIDYRHPNLKPNLAEGYGYNAVDGEDKTDPRDGAGHGTSVAGVIAGAGVGGGPAGVNWNNVNLLTCRFMADNGVGQTSDAIQCLDFCLKAGARIISASWTSGPLANRPLQEAVERTREAGALLVVSAGNQGTDLSKVDFYPQAYAKKYDHILVVAASDEFDDHLPYSNYDPKSVHLSAPGNWIFTTQMGSQYGFTSGTSIAAPFVSGAAALAQAVAQDKLGKTLSAAELKELLLDSAERLPALFGRTQTGARLRVDWALQKLLGRERSSRTPCLQRPGTSGKCDGDRWLLKPSAKRGKKSRKGRSMLSSEAAATALQQPPQAAGGAGSDDAAAPKQQSSRRSMRVGSGLPPF